MAVKEAQRKVTVVAGKAGERLGEGLAAARKRAAPRVEKARKRSGAAVSKTRRRVGYWIAGEQPPSTKRRIGAGLLAGAAGAAAAFFLDPVSGKRRRNVAKDWVAARARGAARRGQRAGRFVGSNAYGMAQRMRHRRDGQVPENDQVLAHKVESELFQGSDLPKGRININAESGVVVLRGQVDTPDQIADIEARVRRIQGVRGVENLLHLPGTPAPTHR